MELEHYRKRKVPLLYNTAGCLIGDDWTVSEEPWAGLFTPPPSESTDLVVEAWGRCGAAAAASSSSTAYMVRFH